MDYSLHEDIIEYIFEKVKYLVIPSESNKYKSKFLQSRAVLYCTVLLLALKIVTVLFSMNIPPNIFFADITRSALESFVNQTRQSSGLSPLKESAKLDTAAQLKAQNMVQLNYFNHTSPSGVSPWHWFVQAGYVYKYAGENLAIGFYDSKEVYEAWLNSSEHKANITNPNYTEIGTAVINGFGPNNSIVVVQEFASPAAAKASVVQNSPPAAKPAPLASNVAQPTSASGVTETQTPEQAVSISTPTQNSNEQVLSQSTELPTYINQGTEKQANKFYLSLYNFILYSYPGILQNVIYAVSMIIVGILLTLIFIDINVNFKKELVFRALTIIILLSAATLVNKDLLITLIPHQVLI